MTRPSALVMLLLGFAVLAAPMAGAAQHADARRTFGAFAKPESLGLSSTRLEDLTQAVRSWVEESRIVGAELLILKERQIVLHESVGWSDVGERRAMARGSVFRLRSMTKPFTGTALLILADEGLVNLDAPVGRYLESWRNDRSGFVTVRHLLSHFSGFEQGGTPAPASSYPDLRSVADASGAQGPQHPPGESFRYSDVNTFALGAIVAEISGMPLERFIRERIVSPLRLDDVFVEFSPDAEWAERTNPTYDRGDEERWERYWKPGEPLTFTWFRASGGMFSTALGYARWLDAWMDGASRTGLAIRGAGGLLSESTTRAAVQLLGQDADGGYGFHWEVLREDPLVFGHGGSDGTVALSVPSQQLILIYFTQSRGHDTRSEWVEAALKATIVK